MQSQGNKLIAIEDVTMRFDRERPVLDNVCLDINRGDFMAITGPNGGGKTTLLRIMLRLLKPTRGRVRYFNAAGEPVSRLHIGYLPQKSNIDTHFPISAGEVVRSGLLRGWFGGISDEGMRRFEEVVDMVGIRSYLDRQIGALSGGQLQRTLLGRAIISDPDVLMLDEPLSYVDKAFEQQIYSLVSELSKTKTIVLITHEMSIISGMANRHIIVDHTIHECGAHHHFVQSECE